MTRFCEFSKRKSLHLFCIFEFRVGFENPDSYQMAPRWYAKGDWTAGCFYQASLMLLKWVASTLIFNCSIGKIWYLVNCIGITFAPVLVSWMSYTISNKPHAQSSTSAMAFSWQKNSVFHTKLNVVVVALVGSYSKLDPCILLKVCAGLFVHAPRRTV